MAEVGKQTLLYTFLTNPKLRIWRHILLILMLAVISIDQTVVVYRQNMDALGKNIYWICAFSLAVYLAVILINLYVLIPRLLLKKKYVLYVLTFSASIMLLIVLRTLTEYITYNALGIPHTRSSYFNYVGVLDGLSFFAIYVISFTGILVTILLKNWFADAQRVSQLEKVNIQSEVEQLKDQINPQFLFNILNRASILAKIESRRTSDMLIKLSQLLRYQLYDCSRDKVLLSSEINFLTNYLVLEKLYADDFEYTISAKGSVDKVFISPLLFIPFVQHAVNHSRSEGQHERININISAGDNLIEFGCTADNIDFSDADFARSRERLGLLYDNFTLSVEKHGVTLQLINA